MDNTKGSRNYIAWADVSESTWVDSPTAKATTTSFVAGPEMDTRGADGMQLNIKAVAKGSDTQLTLLFEDSPNGRDWSFVSAQTAAALSGTVMQSSAYPFELLVPLAGISNGESLSYWIPFRASFLRVKLKGDVGGGTFIVRSTV